MYSEILRSTQNTGSGRQQQMAVARQPGYYGPQPGQSHGAARATAGGSRRQRAPPQAAAARVLDITMVVGLARGLVVLIHTFYHQPHHQ